MAVYLGTGGVNISGSDGVVNSTKLKVVTDVKYDPSTHELQYKYRYVDVLSYGDEQTQTFATAIPLSRI